jgi:hypothetical protein
MTEDFNPRESHDPTEGTVKNSMPGWPAGSDRKAETVVLYQGGNFGKVKHEGIKE